MQVKFLCCVLYILLSGCATGIQNAQGQIDLEKLATATWQMSQPDKDQNIIGTTAMFGHTFTSVFVRIYDAFMLATKVVQYLQDGSMPRDQAIAWAIRIYNTL